MTQLGGRGLITCHVHHKVEDPPVLCGGISGQEIDSPQKYIAGYLKEQLNIRIVDWRINLSAKERGGRTNI
ncbi:MAG: hypothetical protein ABH952_06820 [Candidatus Omnitrophota bacterium]